MSYLLFAEAAKESSNSAVGWLIALGVVAVIIALVLSLVPVKVWFRALVSGAYISVGRLIGMKLRKIKLNMVVEAFIMAKKSGIDIDINEIETHYMAGGDINKVVSAIFALCALIRALTTLLISPPAM